MKYLQLDDLFPRDDDPDGLAELMAEPAGGHNGGRRSWSGGDRLGHESVRHGDAAEAEADGGVGDDGRKRELGTDGMVRAEYLAEDNAGWGIVHPSHGTALTGMRAHVGILHPEDYVNVDALRAAVTARLGTTPEEVQAAYNKLGKPTAARKVLRARLDAALLTVADDDDGNRTMLAAALGINRDTLYMALSRARVAASRP